MWNCKFGAKSGGYLRSDPLHCLLITGYQPDTNWIPTGCQKCRRLQNGSAAFLYISICFCLLL